MLSITHENTYFRSSSIPFWSNSICFNESLHKIWFWTRIHVRITEEIHWLIHVITAYWKQSFINEVGVVHKHFLFQNHVVSKTYTSLRSEFRIMIFIKYIHLYKWVINTATQIIIINYYSQYFCTLWVAIIIVNHIFKKSKNMVSD